MKICFLSSLFGGGHAPEGDRQDRPGRFNRIDGYDYFMFTNINEDMDTGWDIVLNHPGVPDLDKVRKSRYPKFMGWKLLENNYDAIFYCDAYMSPKDSVDWESYVLEMQNNEFGFMQSLHHARHLHPNKPRCINMELDAIWRIGKDTKENIDKTRRFFINDNRHIDLNNPLFFENCTFGYDPNNAVVTQFLSEFWEVYSSEDLTYRDQPLWHFLLLRHGLEPIANNKFAPKIGSRFPYDINKEGDFDWSGVFNH